MQIHAPYACTVKKSLAREKSSQKSPRNGGRLPDINGNEIIIWLINYAGLRLGNPYIFSAWPVITEYPAPADLVYSTAE
ncbi:hypothetical protein BJK05_18850 [Pectobacterium polaris]|uniref:hypothetical protein n=1 Tax=Pectobacterium polaris TaxID=2042057 RepID=UPI000BACD960|nr:hypothetical protein [Pectobacterium polaris]ASY81926.1 hypothetical protein BJK05_18850 [Pectobacterium polaris]MCA6940037.1 hypothetical protein [Pectobacterium polaris]MCA6958686.1 hypothetical protein [Pectobacterium polaris]MCL6361023.1 hypothetical protein [Pectobacterium polaris]